MVSLSLRFVKDTQTMAYDVSCKNEYQLYTAKFSCLDMYLQYGKVGFKCGRVHLFCVRNPLIFEMEILVAIIFLAYANFYCK